MNKPTPAELKPPAAPQKPAPPQPAPPPSQAWATCSSDDVAMVRIRSRRTDEPEAKNTYLKPREWFPPDCQPTEGNHVVSYIDGRCAFEDMGEALATAINSEHRIYIAGWSTNKDTVLKGSSTLENYLRNTRAQIRGLFFSGVMGLSPALSTKVVENKWVTDAINNLGNGAAVQDAKLPPIGIHHQKLLVVQGQFGLVAFIGGMDFDPSRSGVNAGAGWPWHDTQFRIAGPAALQCRKIFEDRWLDHPSTAALDQKLGASATATDGERRALGFPAPAALDLANLPSCTYVPGSKRAAKTDRLVAVGRTFANMGKAGAAPYAFAPDGQYTAWSLIERAIQKCKRRIYLEDQYLVSRMARKALLDRVKDPNFDFLLMVMNGSGAAAADFKYLVTARNEFRRDLLAADPQKKKWGLYTLKQSSDPERMKWCGSYVHSKTWIFDENYVICGSANCDNRGYTYDSEIAVGVADSNAFDIWLGESFATDLRTRLWHKILGLPHSQLRDWDKAIGFWKKPPASALIADASAYELDNDLSPAAQFPSDAEKANVETIWTKVVDPDAR
jgi:phosphatidylserine/phosphatidylglycerophosphate/cardiolipin synthase-like enzyme